MGKELNEDTITKKDIFMSRFKSKIGYSFTYKDLNEFETIIDFYEQQCKKQKEFMKWLEDEIKEVYRDGGLRQNIFRQILQKYEEIIEQKTEPITKESIEALGYACGEMRKCFENGWNKSLENKPFKEDKTIEKCKNYEDFLGIDDYIEHLKNKIDELIDEINKLKEK